MVIDYQRKGSASTVGTAAAETLEDRADRNWREACMVYNAKFYRENEPAVRLRLQTISENACPYTEFARFLATRVPRN